MIEFAILGPLEARVDGRPVDLGPTKVRALLALLLLRANEVVSRSRLIDELWAGQPPARAVNLVQGYVSELRGRLGKEAIVTQGQGYLIRVARESLDLHEFERKSEIGRRALEGNRPLDAAEALRDALSLWRGSPLSDLEFDWLALGAVRRLQELRLSALELRIDADLALGRHAEVIGELEGLLAEHSFHEGLRAQLMLALYRAGRQGEALELFRRGRSALAGDLGIEPGPRLRELERAILRHDPDLVASGPPPPPPSILVGLSGGRGDSASLRLAATLARHPIHELILVRTVSDSSGLMEATARLVEVRDRLRDKGLEARTAAFTSREAAADLNRLAEHEGADLALLQAFSDGLTDPPCDQVTVTGTFEAGGLPVLVLFGGSDQDWAAVELGAWLALAARAPLRIAGRAGEPGADASRLIASASLAIQRVLGLAAEPLLLSVDPRAVAEAANAAAAVVIGLPDRGPIGLKGVRSTAAEAAPCTVLVRRGLRPGGLAPKESLTRFTWSLAAG